MYKEHSKHSISLCTAPYVQISAVIMQANQAKRSKAYALWKRAFVMNIANIESATHHDECP